MLVSCLFNFLTVKKEATFSSETSDDFRSTTQRYTPQNRILYNHRCENLKNPTWLIILFKFQFQLFNELKMTPKFYKHVTLKPSINQWGADYFKAL
jgi:hypothetical protein